MSKEINKPSIETLSDSLYGQSILFYLFRGTDLGNENEKGEDKCWSGFAAALRRPVHF